MTISENANKTAQWWADQLSNASVKLDNGTDDINLLAVLSLCGDKPTYSKEQIEKFRLNLAQYAEAEIIRRGSCQIAVDYNPDDTLIEAAEMAGIKLGGQDLPWKTWTLSKPDKVILSHGYAAPQVEL